MKYLIKIVGAAAFWSGMWLLISAIIELVQRGFVVHYVNTRWMILLFGVSGLIWLILKNNNKNNITI